MPKLLVVDDDLDMPALVRAALEKDGHHVDTEADTATVQPILNLFTSFFYFNSAA